MISLRERAAHHFGLTGGFSVLRDFFCYSLGRRPPGVEHSFRDHLSLIEGKHIHLDVIRVGGEEFDESRNRDIDTSVGNARQVFGTVGIGIKRVTHLLISLADADGLERIDEEKEMDALRRRWRGPNDDAIDVFYVLELNIGNVSGFCRINRTRFSGCNKNIRNTAGCIVDIRDATVAPVLAHELGHHLTLRHESANNDPQNVMFFVNVGGNQFTTDQVEDMLRHCSMRGD